MTDAELAELCRLADLNFTTLVTDHRDLMFTRHLCTICHGLGVDEQGRACPYASVHRAATTPKESAMHNISSPRTDDDGIEASLQAKGLNAPRLSPADIEANIANVEYVKHISAGGQVLRWAVITTRNGFAVTGRPSASVSPANDDAEIGEKVALANSKSELWPLMGYHLKCELARD